MIYIHIIHHLLRRAQCWSKPLRFYHDGAKISIHKRKPPAAPGAASGQAGSRAL